MSIFTASETWPVQPSASRAPNLPPVRLLGDPQQLPLSSHGSSAVRRTTYDAQVSESTPFSKGLIHLPDVNSENCLADLQNMSVSQVFAAAYAPYMKEEAARRGSAPILPSAPPEFGGDGPVNAEDVRRHVRSMAEAYNSTIGVPSAYKMYKQLIQGACVGVKAAAASRRRSLEAETVAVAVPKRSQLKSEVVNAGEICLPGADVEDSDEEYEYVLQVATTDPTVQRDVLSVSLQLLNMEQQSTAGVHLLLRRLRADVALCSSLAKHTVREMIASFSRLAGCAPSDSSRLAQVCAMVGLAVARRRRVGELLAFTEALEKLITASSSIVPLSVPYAKEIVQILSQRPRSVPTGGGFPADGYISEFKKLTIAISEGCVIHHFCVSPDKRFIAAATTEGLAVFKIDAGSLYATHTFPTDIPPCWNVAFSRDGKHIVATMEGKTVHMAFSLELNLMRTVNTDGVCVAVDFADGEIRTARPPLLSSGSKDCFYIAGNEKVFPESGSALRLEKKSWWQGLDSFVFCAHVHRDCSGALLKIQHGEPDRAEQITVSIVSGSLLLEQGSALCSGALPSAAPWYLIEVEWKAGAWSVQVNFAPVPLSGVRATQSQAIDISGVECLHCWGHVGSLGMWHLKNEASGDQASRSFFQDRCVPSAPDLDLLFLFPLDEGTGAWVKELAFNESFTLASDATYAWDDATPVPVASKTSRSKRTASGDTEPADVCIEIPLSHPDLAGGHVVHSGYRCCWLFPSQDKSREDLLVEADLSTSKIQRVQEWPRSSPETQYALSQDECCIYSYQQRFSTFYVADLFTRFRLEETLAQKGSADSEKEETPCSTAWLLQNAYRELYLNSFEFEHVSDHTDKFTLVILDEICLRLHGINRSTRVMKVLSLVTLALSYLRNLQNEESDEICRVALSLKKSSIHVLDFFTAKSVRDAAMLLLEEASMKALTLEDRAHILVELEKSSADRLRSISLRHVASVVEYIVDNFPGKVCGIAGGLLTEVERELSGSRGPLTSAAASMLTPFVLAAVESLRSVGNLPLIADVLDVFVQRARSVCAVPQTLESQGPALLLGLIPMLVCVTMQSVSIPLRAEQQEHLLSLLRVVRKSSEEPAVSSEKEKGGAEESVCFTTRETCDAYAGGSGAEKQWRTTLDLFHAKSVSVVKESFEGELKVLHTRDNDTNASVLSASSRAWRGVDGGIFTLHSATDQSFTVVCQYEFSVDTRMGNIVGEAIGQFFLSLAAHQIHTFTDGGDVPLQSPLLAFGLCDAALKEHGIQLREDKPRVNDSTLAREILTGTGEGKAFADIVCQSMRRSTLPSMRAALEAMLAISVHCGATKAQAEEELKLRWFSGEWGSKLQGDTKEYTHHFLQELAQWVCEKVYYDGDRCFAAPPRRMSFERRHDLSLNCSRSLSERRGSTSSRKSVVRLTPQNDVLEQVRVLYTKGVHPAELENIMVERTRNALDTVSALRTLAALLEVETSNPNEDFWVSMLSVVHRFTSSESGTHFISGLQGCGSDLEELVRESFHQLLHLCFKAISCQCGYRRPQEAFVERIPQGRALMLFYAVLCLPWEAEDFEIMQQHLDSPDDILRFLDSQLFLSVDSVVLTSPWRLRHDSGATKGEKATRLRSIDGAKDTAGKTDASSMGNASIDELLGAANISTLNSMFPNDFSVVDPAISISRTQGGISLDVRCEAAMRLRGDEEWCLSWREGMPRVCYFEVKVTRMTGQMAAGVLHIPAHTRAPPAGTACVYSSAGGNLAGKAEEAGSLPAYLAQDTVGCGILTTTRRAFFTLNGHLLGFTDALPVDAVPPKYIDSAEAIYPHLHFSAGFTGSIVVNFGTMPFAFDYRQLHPALHIRRGPSRLEVATTAAMALHYFTDRTCAITEPKRSTQAMMGKACAEVCSSINKVTLSLMNMGVPAETASAADLRVQHAVAFHIAEYSIFMLISTLRSVVTQSASISEEISKMIFDITSALMLLPLHSIQISTIGLLPDIIVHVKEVPNELSSTSLVSTLFENASVAKLPEERIGFTPMWQECDSNCMSIVDAQCAKMSSGAQRSIVLGSVLPRTGVFSFSIIVNRSGMQKGHSLKGGYFVGVSVAGLTPLTPTSNSQSWKAVKPPIVWAIQDISPQLPHATNPTVKLNSFHRTFGNGEVIRVEVNREKRTVAFYRDGQFLTTLFSDLPEDRDIVPFVQLYNDDASAVLKPGEITAPLTSPVLLSAASVDVLRSMLTIEPFQHLVSQRLCGELESHTYPSVTLAVFNSLPDPRILQLRSPRGDDFSVVVSRIIDIRCKFVVDGRACYEYLRNMRSPAKAEITCSFDTMQEVPPLGGLMECLERLVGALQRSVVQLITFDALCCMEEAGRQRIVCEEADYWDFLFHGLRMGNLFGAINHKAPVGAIRAPTVAVDYTFSAALSHGSFSFPPVYCGRLATVPSGTTTANAPFTAVAEPAFPSSGVHSIQCQLIRGNHGQILGGGYYFGLCTSAFNGSKRECSSMNSDVWALHDMDDSPWRMRHMRQDAVFPVAADPRCIIVSGDVIRLELDVDKGEMFAFRKPIDGDEIALGLIFDNVPTDVPLFPVIQLFNTDAVAVLLPSQLEKPVVRLTQQKGEYAMCVAGSKSTCDGCSASIPSSGTDLWYKCNECADYALCSTCFYRCVHSNHVFTSIGGDAAPLAFSKAPPEYFTEGMKVVIPATSFMYLRSGGCRMHSEFMNCRTEAVEDGAFCAWGLSSGVLSESFTVRIDTIDGSPLGRKAPVFVGLGAVEDVLRSSRDKMRARCFSLSPTLITYCSDGSMRQQWDRCALSPFGFERGSTITFVCRPRDRKVSVYCNWIHIANMTVPKELSASMKSSFCCFVMFGRKGTTATVSPEARPTMVATVTEVESALVKVVNKGLESRYLTKENCRLPLVQGSAEVSKEGTLGYTFVDGQQMQCCVRRLVQTDALGPHVAVTLVQTGEEIVVPLSSLLVSSHAGAIAEERVLTQVHEIKGATMEKGFTISRLLLILCCLCENDALVHLVLLHRDRLLGLLKRLASVEIANDTPLQFLEEVRGAVESTANRSKWASEKRNLDHFIPNLNYEARRRGFKPGMLVSIVDGADMSTICEVVSRKGDYLTLQQLLAGGERDSSSSPFKMPYTCCVPVKQMVRRPWYTLPDGLPDSTRELVARYASDGNKDGRLKHVVLAGEWTGEMSTVKGTYTMRIIFGDRGVASGYVCDEKKLRPSIEYFVLFERNRYSPRVRCYMVAQSLLDRSADLLRLQGKWSEGDDWEGGADKEEDDGGEAPYDRRLKVLKEKLSDLQDEFWTSATVVLDADLDEEGIRIEGTWSGGELGGPGDFFVNAAEHVVVPSAITDTLAVEPLPSCSSKAKPKPPRRRDAPETVHRLIVLLARHLYMIMCENLEEVPNALIDHVPVFMNHPLIDRAISKRISTMQICCMAVSLNSLIVDPGVTPWDAFSLAKILLHNLLLREEVQRKVPPHVVWDSLHAVVTAAHRCCEVQREQLLRDITTFIPYRPYETPIYRQLLTPLLAKLDESMGGSTSSPWNKAEVAAGMDLLLTLGSPFQRGLRNISVAPLHCLVDLWQSFVEGTPLPSVVDELCVSVGEELPEVSCVCSFGQMDGNTLKVGKVTSSIAADSSGAYYYEVTLPDHVSSAFAIGWGAEEHSQVPTQHVGSDFRSFAFNGTELCTREMKSEYKIPTEFVPGPVIGCLLCMDTRTVAWSLNGVVGPTVPIPIQLTSGRLFAFASIGTSKGMAVRLRASEFKYVPDGYTDLSKRSARALLCHYNKSERSSFPVEPISFYAQMASFLSDVEEKSEERESSNEQSLSTSMSLTAAGDCWQHLAGYAQLQSYPREQITRFGNVISIVESCMFTANAVVNLDEATVEGSLSQAFLQCKSLVRRSFRQRLLVNVPALETNDNPHTVLVRASELYAPVPRAPEVALQHSVLAQLYRQVGRYTPSQWNLAPLFKVSLYISGSLHTPIDLGGPYRQMWTFLSYEIMLHPEMCYPHSDFHRNPLFVFANNSQRVTLVPDSSANSSVDLELFRFFGKVMGYAARAKIPLDIDFSPFMWKFLVDDKLTIKEYYTYVDTVVEQSMNDDGFLLSGVADEMIPGFAASTEWLEDDDEDEAEAAMHRRQIGESCLVHSMDQQLEAIREGIWSVLTRRVVRCLFWRDLEVLVCGESNLTIPGLRKYIRCELTGNREAYFWQIVESLTMEQRASLVCFASGQRRLPLIRSITVVENNEKTANLPRAQSCGFLIAIPQYLTLELFREKLLIALEHQMEMELA